MPRPGRAARRRPARRGARRGHPAAPLPGQPAAVFRGTHVREPGLRLLRAREVAVAADRPFTLYADGDPIAELPATVGCSPARCGCWRPHERVLAGRAARAKLAAAKAVGTLARRAGRGGGTSLPGKVLTRLEPHAIGLLAGRLPRGSVVISATNGKTTTAAMVAAVLERTGTRLVHNRAGANMAGGVASALAAASRRGGRELDGDLGLFEVDEFWLGPVVEELQPRAMLLANLFRDQLDRYGELETIADRWAAVVAARRGRTGLVLNADDPLVADLGRADPEALYFGVEDDALAPRRAPARLGLQALPPLRRRLRLRGRLPRPPRPLPLPQLRRAPARARGRGAEAIELRGIRTRRLHAAHAGGQRARRAAAPRPLQRLQRARGRRAVPRARRAARPTSRRASRPSSRRSAARRRSSSAAAPTSMLLVKNPAGANEVLRTLALEAGELDLLGVLNDRTADGRDVSWVWDADWEVLAAARAAHDLLGHPRRRAGAAA